MVTSRSVTHSYQTRVSTTDGTVPVERQSTSCTYMCIYALRRRQGIGYFTMFVLTDRQTCYNYTSDHCNRPAGWPLL